MSWKERSSNFELLRIIAMFMVLILHTEPPIVGFHSVCELWMWNLYHYLCIIAVDLFVFISGYFGIKSTPKSFVKFLTPPIFYTVVLGLLCGVSPFRIPPLFTSPWWFVNTYFLLMVFAPFINIVIEHSSKKQHAWLLVALGFVNLWQGFLQQQPGLISGFTTINLVFIYVLGQYHRRYEIKLWQGKYARISFVLSYFILMASFITVYVFVYNAERFSMRGLVNYYNSPVVLISAFLFFKFFENIKLNSNTINWVASSSFSVYLISNYVYFRETPYQILWDRVYKLLPPPDNYLLTLFMYIILSIVVNILIFMFCIIVDRIRIVLTSHLETCLTEKIKSIHL